MKYFVVMLAVTALFAGLQPAAAQTHNDNLIVPGVRIGPVSLGMSEANLYKTLGDPTSTQINNAAQVINYNYPGLGVSVDRVAHKVTQVTSLDQKYSTAEGIKVGSSGLAVSAKIGIPSGDCQGMCNYSYPNGMFLGTNEDGSVRAIWVVPRAR